MSVIRFIVTEWSSYSLVVFLSVLAKTFLPFAIGLLPDPPELMWIVKAPLYSLKFGLVLVLLLLPFDVFLRWIMTPFDWRFRQVVPLTLCVIGFEVWDKTSRTWPGGSERIMISIGAVAVAGIFAGSFRAWLRRTDQRALDLDVVFE